jgi:hypothetical protein
MTELPPLTHPMPIRFEVAREALRHAIAACSGEPAQAVAGPVGTGHADDSRDALMRLSHTLRMLPALHESELLAVPQRCRFGASEAIDDDAALPTGMRYTLDDTEHARIFNEVIRPALLDASSAADSPRAIVFGAHLGCETAPAMASACEALGGPASAVVLMLEDMRAFHPHYARLMRRSPRLAAFYTDADAARWLDMALQAAVGRRQTLVLQAAMRDPQQIVEAFGFLRANGYHVEARALAFPHACSWQSILHVQELGRLASGIGRTTTAGAHQATFEGLPRMLDRIEREGLSDVVSVFDRHGNCCYRRSCDDAAGHATGTAVTALQIERALPLPLDELRQVRDTFLWLEAALGAPERNGANEELLQIEGLRWDAECALLAQAFLDLPEPECLLAYPKLVDAFDMLRNVCLDARFVEHPIHRELLLKKGREGIARCIVRGNFVVPAPWLHAGR